MTGGSRSVPPSDQPASHDEIVARVREMYRRHPFPPALRKHTYRNHAAYVRRFLEQMGIDAGGQEFGDFACGTGLMMLDYAQEFPDTTFLGYDLSPASVQRANATLAAENALNARALVQDIMQMEDQDRFAYIVSWGTIHHLPDPAEGVAILARALQPGGILRTGIYGYYGNWERRVQQEMLRTLAWDCDPLDFDHKITIVREWATGDRNFKNYYTAPPVDLHDEDWVVDEFLHVWENHLKLADIVSWLEANSMEVLRLTDYYDQEIPLDVAEHSASPEFVRRVKRLPFAQQCGVLEMIVRPYWISLLAQKRA
jgi:SAM-dependent methyltransferase